MESDRFRPLLEAHGPFASVYFDDSQDIDDTTTELDLNCRALREQLKGQGANESTVSAIEDAVIDVRLPVGRGRRAMIAASTGIVLNEYLLQPVAKSVVRVSELPYIVPILENGVAHSHYLLVVADPTGAIITSHNDVARISEAIEMHSRSAGAMPGAERNGNTVPNPSPVADRISELAHDTAFSTVFLVGDPDTRLGLLAALPEPIRDRVISLPIASRRGGYDFEEIQRAIDTTLARQRRSAMDTAAARFTAEEVRHSGLAAEGLDAVCSALHHGKVETPCSSATSTTPPWSPTKR